MANFQKLDNAWLLTGEDGRIEDFGTMETCPEFNGETILCTNRLILPAFVDSHTHLVHAGPRENEFVDRIRGLSYEQIAERGGGILNSSRTLNETSEDQLFEDALKRLYQSIALGTGAIEIKSGYGLSFEGELKMLRVASRIRSVSPIPVKITFLGAHAIPQAYKDRREQYLQMLTHQLLPVIATEQLADYMDVFCEVNYFTPSEMDTLLKAGMKYGLRPKVHVNQFNSIGGIQIALKNKALSVDHLEVLTPEDIEQLAQGDTLCTALPGCSFFIKIPYTPGRMLIDKGLPLALASDYNPGSSPGLSMPFVVSLACIHMGMLPEEAFNAATLNGAAALELSEQLGSIEIGKKAHLIRTRPVPSLNYLPYSFAENWIDQVILS